MIREKKYIKLYKIIDKKLEEYDTLEYYRIETVAINNDNTLIAIACEKTYIKIYDIEL